MQSGIHHINQLLLGEFILVSMHGQEDFAIANLDKMAINLQMIQDAQRIQNAGQPRETIPDLHMNKILPQFGKRLNLHHGFSPYDSLC
jgi:hypothetical protein